jgi:adenosylhomocysteine nucleosidase
MTTEAQFVDTGLAGSLLDGGEPTGQVSDTALQDVPRTVIAFVGMTFEARIAAGPGVSVFTRDSRRELEATAKNARRLGYRGIISFGVAGGLAADLRAGDWVVASAIFESGVAHSTDRGWSGNLLDALGGDARHAPIVGVDSPIAEPAHKRELYRATGAAAVDMESHVASKIAAAHDLAFAALRVVVDPAHRTIPPAALKGLHGGARADGAAVLRDLIARPSQLSRLLRVSLDAYIACCEMERVRQLLGAGFGLTSVVGSGPPPGALANGALAGSDLAQSSAVAT